MSGAILMNDDAPAFYDRAVIGPECEVAAPQELDFEHDVEAAHFTEEHFPIYHPAKFAGDDAPGRLRRVRHLDGVPRGLGNPALLIDFRSLRPRAPDDSKW